MLHPCSADVNERRKLGCSRHADAYNTECSKCTNAIIPKAYFCYQHRKLRGVALASVEAKKDRFEIHQKNLNRGSRRHHVREDSDVEIDNEEKHESEQHVVRDAPRRAGQLARNRPSGLSRDWTYRIGRSWLYGYYVIVKPCGIILWIAPLYRSEGAARVVDIWGDCYYRQVKPTYTWTDSGCKIWQYIRNRARYAELWRFTRWLVDRFHGKKSHNMTADIVNFCTQNCDVGSMDDELREQAAPGIAGKTNSQAQEQVMVKLGKLIWTLSMEHYTQWFTLFWITLDMNTELLCNMKRKGRTFVPPLCLYR